MVRVNTITYISVRYTKRISAMLSCQWGGNTEQHPLEMSAVVMTAVVMSVVCMTFIRLVLLTMAKPMKGHWRASILTIALW